jgi:hypothetical protein
MKFTIHGSNLNFIFVNMNEVEFYFFKEVFIENSNSMEFVNFLEKIKSFIFISKWSH